MHVIKYPRLEDLSAQLQGWKPNFVYVYGGVNGDKKDLEKQSVSHLNFLVDNQGAGSGRPLWELHGHNCHSATSSLVRPFTVLCLSLWSLGAATAGPGACISSLQLHAYQG